MGGCQPSLEGVPTSDTGTFWQKTHVKMKEFGPVGGRVPETFVCRSATEDVLEIHTSFHSTECQLYLHSVMVTIFYFLFFLFWINY